MQFLFILIYIYFSGLKFDMIKKHNFCTIVLVIPNVFIVQILHRFRSSFLMYRIMLLSYGKINKNLFIVKISYFFKLILVKINLLIYFNSNSSQ